MCIGAASWWNSHCALDGRSNPVISFNTITLIAPINTSWVIYVPVICPVLGFFPMGLGAAEGCILLFLLSQSKQVFLFTFTTFTCGSERRGKRLRCSWKMFSSAWPWHFNAEKTCTYCTRREPRQLAQVFLKDNPAHAQALVVSDYNWWIRLREALLYHTFPCL